MVWLSATMKDIMEIYEARDAVRQRLAEAHKEQERLANLVPQLERQLEGIESFIAFHEAESNGEVVRLPKPPARDRIDLASLTRPNAILAVLREDRGPFSPNDIVQKLREGGRSNDDSHKVGTALSRLKSRRLVQTLGYGRWTLGPLLPSQSYLEGRYEMR
jgi:hypothetical protein